MTGRRRFNCVSHEQELKMGAESYREVLHSERGKVLPDYHPLTRTVDRVLQRLIPQAPIEGANWKVHVIKDDRMANAFVLPGYVLATWVYTQQSILRITNALQRESLRLHWHPADLPR